MDTTTAGQVVMTPSSSPTSSHAGGDQASPDGALVSLNAPDLPITVIEDPEAGWFGSLLRVSSWTPNLSSVWWYPPTPISAAGSVHGDAHAQGPLFTSVLALLAYGAGAMVGILADFKDTISRWRTDVPKILYGVTAVLAVMFLAVGFMAALPAAMAAKSGDLRISAFCARLGAILSSVLLVVTLCCKLGRWGCATGVPCAAVIAVLMAVLWIWGDERAAAQAVANCWRRIKDLCPRCLIGTPSTRDVELTGREGDGIV